MERLWERSREERKETNRKAEYQNREGTHGKPGGRERGRPRKRKRSTAEATVRRRQEEAGKEIADEAIRETACVEAERLKPPLNDGGEKAEIVSTEKSGLFCFYGFCYLAARAF